jgi:FkbM family methyltransferase
MQRFLKRLLSPVVPRWVADHLRDRERNRLNRGEVKEVTTESDGDAIRCTIDQRWSFLAPKECAYDLELHRSSQEGRAELSGMADAGLKGSTLFDIGAHMGIMSALFCAMQPANRAYSFEPSPLTRKRLEVIRGLNKLEDRMFIQPTAIGRDRSKLEMLLDPVGGYVQVQQFDHAGWAEPQRIEVDVESIAQASERLGVVPDFIKLDIEGFEHEALEGSLAFLKQHHPTLLFELHSNYLDQRGLSPRQVVTMLTDCGYNFSSYTGLPLSADSIADSPLQGLRFRAYAKTTTQDKLAASARA